MHCHKEAHHSCCESLFGVLLTYTMQWDIMEANNSDAKNEESDALTYAFINYIRRQVNRCPKGLKESLVLE